MTVKVRNITLAGLKPFWTGTAVGYQMAYLTPEHKAALALPKSSEYAIRIDVSQASLVKIAGDYTGWRADAEIVN